MWWFYRKGPSGFAGASTAEEVTAGTDGRGLVAVITGTYLTTSTVPRRVNCQHRNFGSDCRHINLGACVPAGASSGIGRETARVLALRGVRVVMAVRDVSAGIRAKEAIQAELHGGAEVDVLQLDLSSMASVRRFADEFGSLNLPLNILM
jgi:predicted amino acid dehydrogenase